MYFERGICDSPSRQRLDRQEYFIFWGSFFTVDIEMDNRKLKKSLDYANKKRIPLVIILGENDLKADIVKIKNMLTGQNSEVVRSELTPYLRSLIPKPGWNLT